MKYSTTVLLSVLALPCLVNSRPSSRRAFDEDIPITSGPETEFLKSLLLDSIPGSLSHGAGAKTDYVEGNIAPPQQDQPDVYGIKKTSVADIERRLIKRARVDDYIRGGRKGLALDGPQRYAVETAGYKIDLGDSTTRSSQGDLQLGYLAEDGLVPGIEVGDLKGTGDGVNSAGGLWGYNVEIFDFDTDQYIPKSNSASPDVLDRRVEVHVPRKRRAMEAAAKRFHAHNRHRRSRVFSKRDAPTDIDILNFALTFEHLVSAFYKHGLEKYGVKKFREAGYQGWIRRRYEQLAKNGRTHVEFLESALGERAVKACGYDLKDKDVQDWVTKSFVVENIAASAWNGVVGILQDRAYQTVAASIMGVKARHAAWINSVVRKSNAWNTPFETPLDMNQIYSIISPFIIPGSCPSANPPPRATPFPALHVPPCHPGSVIALEFDFSLAKEADKQKQQLFAAFVSGTGTVFVSLREERKVEVPKGLVGIVYVFITKDGGKVGNEAIVAGPGVVWFGFK